MPAKAATRKLSPARRERPARVPTTIKSPERVARRRAELIDVATRMFLERGFHNTSIRDIVARLYLQCRQPLHVRVLQGGHPLSCRARPYEQHRREACGGGARSGVAGALVGDRLHELLPDRLQIRRRIRLLYREVGFLPPEPRANVIATVSSVISYFEAIVAEGIEAGVFRKVPRGSLASM